MRKRLTEAQKRRNAMKKSYLRKAKTAQKKADKLGEKIHSMSQARDILVHKFRKYMDLANE